MKLQLGTSRHDKLSPNALGYFLKPGWVHFGDAAGESSSFEKARQLARDYGWKISWSVVRRKVSQRRSAHRMPAALAVAEVEPFYFCTGDALPFADDEVDFVYAEHFFEHLFLDEAMALLREIARVPAPGRILRIASPDADLRRNQPPEPAGFSWVGMPFAHPEKHKTRWSV